MSLIHGADDLELLTQALAALPPGVPVVQYVLDCTAGTIASLAARLLSAPLWETWTTGAEMARAIRARVFASAFRPRARALGRPHGARAAPHPSSRRRRFPGGDGRAGAATVDRARRASRGARCRESIPGLPPVDWYTHPTDVQAIVDFGVDLGDEIVWRGSYRGDALHARLKAADLALLPVDAERQAPDDRTRFVAPPGLMDLCAAGLPLFGIASPDSQAALLLEAHRAGICAAGPDEQAIARRLVDLIGNRERRATLGMNARAFAGTAGGRGSAPTGAISRMVRLSRRFTPPEHWTGPRQEGLVRLAGSERAASARLEDVLADRIHYACGRNVLPGWLNVDGYDESFPSGEVPAEIAGRIFRLDLTGRHPFPDNYFRLGYSEDFIEHIDQAEFISFLCECFRTFRPGGVLRLSSPGLEGVLGRHLRGSDWQAAHVLREEAYARWWHKHFLCLAEVEAIARHIGWREVGRAPYGSSAVPDLQQETRPSQADLNLVVELVK